jgi:hypothetical protein
MIGTVFASPRGEINEMEIHIAGLLRGTPSPFGAK